MFTYLRTLAAGLALAALMACQPKNEPVESAGVSAARDEVHQAAELWENAYNARSPGAVASVFTDDAWLMLPDASVVIGQRAIQDYLESVWTKTPMKISIGETELEILGSAGWRAGRFEGRDPTTGDIDMRGSFVEIWRKVDDRWRMHRSIWTLESRNTTETAAPQA